MRADGTGGILCGKDGVLLLNPAFAPAFREAGLTSPGDFLSAGTVVRRKGRKENAVLSVAVEGREAMFHLKRHSGPRSSQGLIEWARTAAAAAARVPTAEPAAAGRCRAGSFFCSARIPGAEPLDGLLASGRLGPKARKILILEAAKISAVMHSAGWFHRDLYLCHFMARPPAPGGGPFLWLIDLERLTRPRILRRRWMVKDLAALHYSSAAAGASGSDRLRFMLAYLAGRGMRPGPRAMRKLAADVRAKSRRIEAHDLRSREGR